MTILWCLKHAQHGSRPKQIVFVGTLALALAWSVLPNSAPKVQAAFPGRNGRIAFSACASPRVTTPVGFGFVSDCNLFTVSPTGPDLNQVTSGPEIDYDPAWSPDGGRIAFARTDPSQIFSEIFVVESAGGEATNLTASPLDYDDRPSWSPDGTKIVYTSFNYTSETWSEIHLMDSDGGNVAALTEDPGDQWGPAWSPQGDVVAYIDDADELGSSVRLIHTDGSQAGFVVRPERALTIGYLSWSPDGRKIVFSTTHDIFVVNRDGSGLRNLTGAPSGREWLNPSWSPDGKWIAFLSNRKGDYKLYKMRTDGSDVSKVVDITLTSKIFSQIGWGPRP